MAKKRTDGSQFKTQSFRDPCYGVGWLARFFLEPVSHTAPKSHLSAVKECSQLSHTKQASSGVTTCFYGLFNGRDGSDQGGGLE